MFSSAVGLRRYSTKICDRGRGDTLLFRSAGFEEE